MKFLHRSIPIIAGSFGCLIALAGVTLDPDVSVVLMGSWGRGELTSGSDDDVLVLATGEDRPAEAIRPSVEELRAALRPPAGKQGIFNRAVSVARLANIGLDADALAGAPVAAAL